MHRGGAGVRADVQGLRALAVLAVVLYHVDRALPGGFVGVDVFFVISGYVIARSLLRRSGPEGRVSLVDFYRRRALRILPALVVFLVGTIPLLLVGPAATVDAASRTAAAAVVFVANLQLAAIDGSGYFAASAELNPYLHLWSLSVEEQFYVGFPFLLVFALRRRRADPQRSLRPPIVVAMVGSFLLMMAAILAGRIDAAFYLAPTRAWQFLAGVLLATAACAPRHAVVAGVLRIGGLAAIGATAIAASAGQWPGPLTVVTTAGTAAVIAAGSDHGAGRAFLTNRAMVFVGALSYSWYLWHWPLVVIADANAPGIGWVDDVAALAALLPAWLSWRFVEEPLRSAALPPVRTVAVRGTAALAVLALVALVLVPAVAERLPGNLDQIEEAASVHDIVLLDSCPSGPPAGDSTDERCGRRGDPARTAVLVGDSFAAQVADPFRRASTTAAWGPVVRTRTDCAFLPGLVLYDNDVADVECATHNAAVWEYLRNERPAVAVVSNRLAPALTEPEYSVASADGAPTDDLDERATAVRAAYHDMVEVLRAQGTEVVLLRGTPETPAFALTGCTRLRWLLDRSGCSRSTTLDDARARRVHADAVVDEVASAHGLRILDFDRLLCPDGCRAFRDGEWVYADHGHMTARFARTLEPLFQGLFADDDSRRSAEEVLAPVDHAVGSPDATRVPDGSAPPQPSDTPTTLSPLDPAIPDPPALPPVSTPPTTLDDLLSDPPDPTDPDPLDVLSGLRGVPPSEFSDG